MSGSRVTSGDSSRRGILAVGAASLCSDAGHELVTSLLPSFLTSTLGAGAAALGAIDGAADALTGLAKLAGGPLAADPRRRSRLAAGGYLGTAAATALIGATVAVWQVAVLRAAAWVSRGLRSPARDMVLTTLATQDRYGRAFGVERAGDNAGAIAGPLLASLLVGTLGVRACILLAVVPGVLAAAAISVAVREARRLAADTGARAGLALRIGELRRAGLLRVLAPVAAFECGNLASTLLILRATDLLAGRSGQAATSVAILLYAGHNAAACVAAWWGGRAVDRVGAGPALAIGAVLYAVAYLGLAAGPAGWPALLTLFLLAGTGIGVAEPAESTLVARRLGEELRAAGFGVLGLVQSAGDLVATVVAGVLWSALSAGAAFCWAAGWMLLSVLAGGLLRPGRAARPG